MPNTLTSSEYGQLRDFVAVAEAQGFTRAARRLGVSSSALSQTIRLLEERVGARLLNRTTRSVSLTAAGETLFRRVRPIVGFLAAAVDDLSKRSEKPSGVLRILSFRSAADLYLRPFLRSFTDAYPDIVLDITLDDAVVDMVAGGYDVALRIGEVIERDLIALRLGPELSQIAVASPDYLARAGTPKTPADLASHRCLAWIWQGHERPYRWEFRDPKTQRWFDVEVRGPIIVNSRHLTIQAAIDGIGIAFAVRTVVEDDIAAGRLVPLLERWSGTFPGYFLCYPSSRQMAPALRAFLRAATESSRDRASGPPRSAGSSPRARS